LAGHVILEPNIPLDRLAETAARRFEERFHRSPGWMAVAPGRVNIIGEHIDYNDGFVLPMAIERYVVVAADTSSHTRTLHLYSDPLKEEIRLALDDPQATRGWARYAAGVVAGFENRGNQVPSFDALILSNVPLGGGLSSSAALEVAVATLLEGLTGQTLEPAQKALLCQKAEHDYAGVPCGIMDQFSSVFGKKDQLLLLDCRSQEIQDVPFQSPDLAILVTNCNVKHELTGGEYAKRRAECDAALLKIGRPGWREVSMMEWEQARAKLSDVEARRAKHVISEIARTRQAAEAIAEGDWTTLGSLMDASHQSLNHDFEVSCDELNALVEIAQGIGPEGGVFGSRMTGGGFGGCTVTLAKTDQLPSITRTIHDLYAARVGITPHLFATRPAMGAAILRGR
jgi:galactokinase